MFNPNPSPASIPVGSIIADKYRVERVVGKGGMGVVVAARHIKLHESVAIKLMLNDELCNRESVERFLREARACSKLRNNEHIVRVTDVDTLPNGLPYMVMELLEGKDLDKLLKDHGVLPIHDACAHLIQACEALGEAHQKGIIHRDLKPQNLFLTRRPDGSPCIKVLDFGISKHTFMEESGNMDLTRPSDILGSAYYMSPEQARSSRSVVPQSDIYSLGAVLYKLLTGRAPFPRKTMLEVYEALLTESPPLPSQFRKEIPAGLESIIMRCLDKKIELRFPGARELIAALAPFTVPTEKAAIDDTDSDVVTTLPRVRAAKLTSLSGTLPLEGAVELPARKGANTPRQSLRDSAQRRAIAASSTTQPLDAKSLHAALHEYLPPQSIPRPAAPSEPRLPSNDGRNFDESTPLLAPQIPPRPAPLRDEPAPRSISSMHPVTIHPQGLPTPATATRTPLPKSTTATQTPLPISRHSAATHETVYFKSAAQILNTPTTKNAAMGSAVPNNEVTIGPWNSFPAPPPISNGRRVALAIIAVMLVLISICLSILLLS
ncbi:MAG TPA: protein kinase [Polyangium sp.]|nr:protein kinase [Polyangium sp.]